MKLIQLDSISRFNQNLLDSANISKGSFSINSVFWNSILDKKCFSDFIKGKYLPSKKKKLFDEKEFVDDYSFLLKNIDYVKSVLLMQNNVCISAPDSIFSFKILNKILSYYNEYYDDINISLYEGVVFKKIGMEDFLDKPGLILKSRFVQDQIIPYLKSLNIRNSLVVYKIFWPHELVSFMIFSKIIGDSTNKYILDASRIYEQIDIKSFFGWFEDHRKIFDYINYIIVNNDFDVTKANLIKKLSSGGSVESIDNILYYDDRLGKVIFKYKKTDYDTNDFDPARFVVGNLLGKKYYEGRLLPYRCHWSSCYFCVINSNSIYPYKLDGYNIWIDKFIDCVEKNKIYYVKFTDEAIPSKVLLQLAEKLIEKGIKIEYMFRCRFSKDFTKTKCILLYKSGARYCGMGLESASDRLNKYINKGYDEIDIKQKQNIIDNFDKAGISFHNYAILGLPTENSQELNKTRDFLIGNIRNCNNYTCSPNPFGVKKGSYIGDNPGKFGIKLKESLKSGFGKESFHYDYKLSSEVRDSIYKIHKEQFFPNIENISNKEILAFRRFIDYSKIIYLMKISNKIWPFKDIFIDKIDIDLHKKYKISPYVQIILRSDLLVINNWIINEKIFFPLEFRNFFNNYDQSLSLNQNLINSSIDINTNKDNIRLFLSKKILLKND